MNIDYSTIITKANDRKEILQELETLSRDASRFISNFAELTSFLTRVGDLFEKLDGEGKKLIPEINRSGFGSASYCAGNNCSEVLQVLRKLSDVTP